MRRFLSHSERTPSAILRHLCRLQLIALVKFWFISPQVIIIKAFRFVWTMTFSLEFLIFMKVKKLSHRPYFWRAPTLTLLRSIRWFIRPLWSWTTCSTWILYESSEKDMSVVYDFQWQNVNHEKNVHVEKCFQIQSNYFESVIIHWALSIRYHQNEVFLYIHMQHVPIAVD